jgi:hypothetical protein
LVRINSETVSACSIKEGKLHSARVKSLGDENLVFSSLKHHCVVKLKRSRGLEKEEIFVFG